MNDNSTQQSEEIEALFAIYGTEWHRENDIENSYYIQITPDVQLSVTLNSDYPSTKPPTYQLLAPKLKKEQKLCIAKEFDEIYKINFGGPVLFQWIEKLKEIVNEDVQEQVESKVEEEVMKPVSAEKPHNYNIIHGPVIKDRKSIFQGHACQIYNNQELREALDLIIAAKKISQATHNIIAYRITLSNGALLQDCDDDGENQAGGRLLHLLQILDVANTLVVVSRWYGGIQLGPDRFRHINNAARQVLLQAGFISKKT